MIDLFPIGGMHRSFIIDSAMNDAESAPSSSSGARYNLMTERANMVSGFSCSQIRNSIHYVASRGLEIVKMQVEL